MCWCRERNRGSGGRRSGVRLSVGAALDMRAGRLKATHDGQENKTRNRKKKIKKKMMWERVVKAGGCNARAHTVCDVGVMGAQNVPPFGGPHGQVETRQRQTLGSRCPKTPPQRKETDEWTEMTIVLDFRPTPLRPQRTEDRRMSSTLGSTTQRRSPFAAAEVGPRMKWLTLRHMEGSVMSIESTCSRFIKSLP